MQAWIDGAHVLHDQPLILYGLLSVLQKPASTDTGGFAKRILDLAYLYVKLSWPWASIACRGDVDSFREPAELLLRAGHTGQ